MGSWSGSSRVVYVESNEEPVKAITEERIRSREQKHHSTFCREEGKEREAGQRPYHKRP